MHFCALKFQRILISREKHSSMSKNSLLILTAWNPSMKLFVKYVQRFACFFWMISNLIISILVIFMLEDVKFKCCISWKCHKIKQILIEMYFYLWIQIIYHRIRTKCLANHKKQQLNEQKKFAFLPIHAKRFFKIKWYYPVYFIFSILNENILWHLQMSFFFCHRSIFWFI